MEADSILVNTPFGGGGEAIIFQDLFDGAQVDSFTELTRTPDIGAYIAPTQGSLDGVGNFSPYLGIYQRYAQVAKDASKAYRMTFTLNRYIGYDSRYVRTGISIAGAGSGFAISSCITSSLTPTSLYKLTARATESASCKYC